MEHRKHNLNIILVFGILFLVVTVLLLLVFFAGKKTYVVEFDLNGGTLVSGSLQQHITQGQSATPPVVHKDGAYLKEWSQPYNKITKDVVISAVWSSETTPGIVYANSTNQNFVEIAGAYKHIRGDVYLGDYYGEKKVLGIQDNAFADYFEITKIRLPDGLIHIGNGAFSGCTGLTAIEIPKAVTNIGADAFSGCSSIEQIILNDGLLEIGKGAFRNCTSLKEIVIPASVLRIANDAFDGCDDLIIKTSVSKEDMPEGWQDGWRGSAGVVWLGAEDVIETETETEEETFIKFPIHDPFRPVIRPPKPTTEESVEVEEPEESNQPDDPEDVTETETESTTEEETFIKFPIRDPLRPVIRPTDTPTEESVEVEEPEESDQPDGIKQSVSKELTTGE